MAIGESALFKKLKGKIGNIIVYTVNDQVRIRHFSEDHKDAKTPKQIAHRTKVKGVAALYKELSMQLVVYWKQLAINTMYSGYNLFVSANIRNIDKEGQIIAMDKFKVCDGTLPLPISIDSQVTPNRTITITWNNDPESGDCGMYEFLRIAVYTPGQKKDPDTYILAETEVRRSDQTYEYPISESIPQPAHFFLFFKNHFTNDISPSYYLGSI